MRRILDELAEAEGIDCRPHDIVVRKTGGELQLTFHCTLAANMPIADAHTLSERIESLLRSHMPNLGRVVIHVEPNEM